MPHISLNILTARNIVEGLVASIFIVFTYYVLRNYYKLSKPMASMGGWFITWTLRKLSVNLYTYLNERYGFTIQPLKLSLH
jgi:hypothetical protein